MTAVPREEGISPALGLVCICDLHFAPVMSWNLPSYRCDYVIRGRVNIKLLRDCCCLVAKLCLTLL